MSMNIVTFISLLVVLLFFLYFRKVSKLKINFILGNNTVEPKGVMSLYFGEDLDVITNYYL